MNHPLFAAAISLAVLVPATAGAKVVSGTPFADNMVLQRGRAVKVKLAWPDNNNWKGFREQFEDEYRRLWLLQNRPGGLEESLDWQFCR